MKIAFFNLSNIEEEFLKSNLPSYIYGYFTSRDLNENTYEEEKFEEFDAISVSIISKLNFEVLNRFKNLKYIFTRSVGFNHIDLDYCNKNNIKVFNTPHYGDYTIAEFTFGILLSIIRKINLSSNDLKEGRIYPENYLGIELYNKTLGIIGLGSIGMKVEKIARGFSMNTICYDVQRKENYNMVSLSELMEQSDIISLHAPLNNGTFHILNEDCFNKMKSGVIIVNTARGELIETEALIKNLISKKVSYAALDVIECEKLINNTSFDDICIDCISDNCLRKFMLNTKLLSNERVIITPHIAYNTLEAVKRILAITIENIKNAENNTDENLVK